MPEKTFYGAVVKVSRVYSLVSSLVVTYRDGPWHQVGDKVVEILKSMHRVWKSRGYRLYYHEFECGSSKWILYLDMFEMAGSAVDPKETVLKIYMRRIEPSALHFSVIYHPKTVNLDAVNLEELLKSLLYRLPHIAEDVNRFSWASLLDKNYIIAYHDRKLVTRIDFIFSHLKLPYQFVVSYHIDDSRLSVDFHVTTDGKSEFDMMVESILDEYYSEIVGGGGEG